MDYQNKIRELERTIQILETGINNTRDVNKMNRNRNKIDILNEEIKALKNKKLVLQQPVVQQQVVQQPVVQLTLKDLDKMIVEKSNEIKKENEKNETDKDKLNKLKEELENLKTRHANMKGGYNPNIDYKRLYLKYKSKYIKIKNSDRFFNKEIDNTNNLKGGFDIVEYLLNSEEEQLGGDDLPDFLSATEF